MPRRRIRPLQIGLGTSSLALALLAGPAFGFAPNDASLATEPLLTAEGLMIPADARTIEIPGSEAIARVWDEMNDAGLMHTVYAVSLDGGSTFSMVRPAREKVMLRHGEFNPARGVPEVHPELRASDDNRIFIVQFETQAMSAIQNDLASRGITLHKFLPNQAFIVEMDPTTQAELEGLNYVRWVGAYHPAYRLDDRMAQKHFPWGYHADDDGPIDFGDQNHQHGGENVLGVDQGQGLGEGEVAAQIYSIQVFERGARQKELVANFIEEIGGTVEHLIPDGFLLRATLDLDQVVAVLHRNEILYMDPWSEPEVDMDNARLIGGAVSLENSTGFRGQGVRAEVFDSGIRETHQDFPDVLIHNGDNFDTWHGTSTSGQVFGSGGGNATATGMLPEVEQAIFGSFYNLTNRYTHTSQLVDPNGPYRAVFQTNSWGGGRTLDYTTESMEIDDIIFLNDFTITQSQSNAGTQMSRPQAWGKNIIAVGGVNHRNTQDKGDDCWCRGASIGPARDGRIKPDLWHFYDSIFTLDDDHDSDYQTSFGGTSGATPIVAGYLGLVYQLWHEGVFRGYGGGDSVFDDRPHSSTAKALAINSAVPHDFSGVSHDLTRVHQGWGMPHVDDLFNARHKMLIDNEETILTEFESATYNMFVYPGEPDLRATLVYTDLAGTTSASKHRINDLTLIVTSPTGTIYYGNNGLREGLWSIPNGNATDLDTVENVFVQNPESGVWRIEVWAFEVNEDSHTETGAMDVDFALVVSGGISETPMVLESGPLNGGETSNVTVTGATADGSVYLVYSLAGEGFTYIPALHVALDIVEPKLAATATADGNGDVTFNETVPSVSRVVPIWLQAAEQGNASNVVATQINP